MTGPSESYGWSGILRGAGVVFFVISAFDAVSTAAQESKNPQRDMPVGILGSISHLHDSVSAGLRSADGPVHYSRLNIGAPVSLAIRETGVRWGSYG